MPDSQVITLVTNWPQAIVAVVLILALIVWPGVMAWLQARRSALTVNKVHENLTTNNGGSHTKDALDRIEQTQAVLATDVAKLSDRMTAVEDVITKPGG